MPKTFYHTLRFLLRLDQPYSQTSNNERDALRKYSRDKKNVVEIGVFEGLTSEIIANSIHENGHLYAIDPFFKGRIGICYSEIMTKIYWKRKDCYNKIKIIKDLSFNAAEYITGPFDFLFIDGDHSYEGIKKDWEDWSKKLNTDGLVLLHDTCKSDHNPDVHKLGSFKYFNEVIINDKRFNLIDQVDTLSILKKL